MKKLIIILLLFPLTSSAQSEAAHQDSIFLDASWNITKYRSQAKFYREIQRNGQDSMLTIYDYFLSTNHTQMIGTYIKEMKPSNQHGRFQYFYSDGTMKAIYDYRWGIIHGELRRYYRNGEVKSIEQFDLGTKVDTTWTYFDNGQLSSIRTQNKEFSSNNPSDKFKKTLLMSSFSRAGEEQVVKGSGVFKDYYLTGKLKTEINYANGFPHGKWTKFSGQKKKLSCVMTFKEGRFIKGEMHDNGKRDIFSSLQRTAYFPTGKKGLEKFVYDNIGRCVEAFENEVLVLVTISKQGKVTLDQIISGNTNACQLEEIQMMISNMPIWAPAVNDGQYVEGSRSIKISYSK